MNYEIVYNNDTGPRDESFWEWWEVWDTEKDEIVCKCNTEQRAKELTALLEKSKPIEKGCSDDYPVIEPQTWKNED